MIARFLSIAALAVALLLSPLKVSAQNALPRLQIGDSLPLLAGHSLPGDAVELPSAAKGHRVLILFSFSRAGGQRAEDWIQHLSQEIPDVSIYSVMFLESVPGPFRSAVVSRIKSRTQPRQQSGTVLLYAGRNAWKQHLQTCIAEDVCILLLAPDSRIRWMTGGAFSANSDQALRSQLKSMGHQ